MVTALGVVVAGKTFSPDLLLQLVIAGYLGTDVIEAFAGKFLSSANKPVLLNAAPALAAPTTLSHAMLDLDASLTHFSAIQRKLNVKPSLTYSTIMDKLKERYVTDVAKWKDSDAPPALRGDAGLLDFLSALFNRQGLDYTPQGQDTDNLHWDSYAHLADSIGLLFQSKGGIYVKQ